MRRSSESFHCDFVKARGTTRGRQSQILTWAAVEASEIMTFQRESRTFVRQVLIFKRPAASLSLSSFSVSLSRSFYPASADSSCARRPGVSFDLARATKLPPSLPPPPPPLSLLLLLAAFIARRYKPKRRFPAAFGTCFTADTRLLLLPARYAIARPRPP